MLQEDEGNIIIAKFMNLWECENGWLYHPNFDRAFKDDELLYMKSWDWLMPVVEKCRERQIFNSNRLINQITDSLVTLDIDAVWIACLEFIQFYNQKNDKAMLYQEAKKLGLVQNLIPVHINKCRCTSYFWDWSTDLKDWVRGETIPEHLKRMYNQPVTRTTYDKKN